MAKEIQNLINLNPGNGYQERPEMPGLQKQMINKLNRMLGAPEGYEFTLLDQADNSLDYNKAISGVDTALDIIENGGDLYAIDIETIGDVFGSQASDKNMASITEVGISRKNFSKNAAGQMVESKIHHEMNVLFGLDKTVESESLRLIQKAEMMPWKDLTDLEKSTLDRFARASSSIRKNADGGYGVIAGALSYDPRDIAQMYAGRSILLDVGKVQGINTDIGKKNIEKLRALAQKGSTGRNAMAAHNGIVFDFPRMTEQLGMKFGENIVDPLYSMNALNYDPDNYYSKFKNGSKIKSNSMRQVNLAEGAGLNVIQAHTALADTDTLVEIISNKVLLKDLKNKQVEIEASKRVLNSNNPVFRVDNSIKRTGDWGSEGLGLDFRSVLNFKTSKEEIMYDEDWILNRGRYYEVDSFRKVDDSFIKSLGNTQQALDLAKATSENKTLYAMKVRTKAKGSMEYATIVRSNVEDFERLLGGNVSIPTNVTQSIIDASDRAYATDAARREWQGFFQVGEGGHRKAQQYYGAYQELNESYNKLGGQGKLTKAQVEELVQYGSIDVSGKTLKANKSLTKLGNKDGVSFAKKRNFAGMYDLLGDTDEVMIPLLNEIEKAIQPDGLNGKFTNKLNRDRTIASRIAFSKIGESIGLGGIFDESGDFVSGVNSVARPLSPADFSYIPLPGANGEIGRINVGKEKKLASSLYRDLKKGARDSRFDIERDVSMKKRMTGMIDFYMGGVIPEGSAGYEKLTGLKNRVSSGHTDFFNMSKTLASILHGEVSSLMEGVTEGELVNIDNAILALGKVTKAPKYDKRRNQLERLREIQNAGQSQSTFNMKGFKKEGASFNVLAKNIDMKEMARIGSNHNFSGSLDLSDLITSKKLNGIDVYDFNPAAVSMIKGTLGYGDEEIENLGRFFKNMDYNNKNGTGPQLSVSLNKVSSNGSDQYVMSIFKQSNYDSVVKSLAKGEMYKDAINLELATIKEAFGMKYIEKGGMNKANTRGISFYIDKHNLNTAASVVMKDSTVIGEAMSALNKNQAGIFEAFKPGGNIRGMSDRLNRSYSKSIIGATGFTGYEYLQTAYGLQRTFLPNSGDFGKAGDFDMTGLMNFAPMLYKEDKEFSGIIDNLMLEKSGQAPRRTNAKMEAWLKGLETGQSKFMKDYDEIDGPLKEYMTTLMFHGKRIGEKYGPEYDKLDTRILDRIKNLSYFKDNESAQSIFESIDNATQIMKEKEVSDGMATLTPYTAYNTWGVYSDHNRPPQIQRSRYHSLDLGTITANNKDKIKELNSKGLFLGRSVVDESLIRDVYDRYAKDGTRSIETGFSGIYKAMDEEEIYATIQSVFKENSFTEELAKMTGLTNPDESAKVIDAAMRSLYRQSSTTEQGSISHPALNDIHTTLNAETFGFDPMSVTLDPKIRTGSTIKTGDVIGTKIDKRGKVHDVLYDKRDGIVQDMGTKSFDILPDKQFINEKKIIMNSTEKSITKVYNIEGLDESLKAKVGAPNLRRLEESIYAKVFGKNTINVGAYEVVKHESASYLLGSDIDYVAQRILSGTDETNKRDFMALFGENFKTMNGKITTLHGGTRYQKEVLQISQLTSQDNFYDGYRGFMSGLRDSKNASLHNIYKDIETNFFDGNMEAGIRTGGFADFAIGQNSAEFGSQTEQTQFMNKGMKSTYNSRQVSGTYLGGDLSQLAGFREFQDGKYQRAIQPLLDREWEEVMSSSSAIGARKDLTNIQEAIRLSKGMDSKANMVTLSLSDINIPSGGVSAADLGDTLYGQYKDFDVVKVVLPEGMNVNNYYLDPIKGTRQTNKAYQKTNELFIPMQRYAPRIDDEFYKSSEMMKRTADMISAAKIVQENRGNGNETIKESLQRLDETLRRFVNAADYEFNNKDGLMMSQVMTKRLNYSGHELIGKIYAPLFDKNGEFQNIGVNGSVTKMFGKEKRAIDVTWMSEQAFTKKAGEGIFEQVGKQALEEYQYSGFSKGLMDKMDALGKGNLTKEVYEQMGKEYMSQVGLPGSVTRYPAFMPMSEQYSYIRLNGEAESDSVSVVQWLSKKFNGDTDGDTVGIKLLLNKTDNGPRMLSKNGVHMKAFETAIEGQSIINQGVIKGIQEKRAGAISGIRPHLEKTLSEWENVNKKDGFSFLKDLGITYSATKTRYDKISVGMASNPNKYMRDVAAEVYSKSLSGVKAQTDLSDFTNFTEENIISIKHLKDPSKVIGKERIALASEYNQALTKMMGRDLEGGTKQLINQLDMVGFWGDKIDAAEKYKTLLESPIEKLGDKDRQVRTVYEMMKNSEFRELMNNPMMKNGSGGLRINKDITDRISTFDEETGGLTQMTREKAQALYRESSGKDIEVGKFYSGLDGNYKVVDEGVGNSSALSYATLEELTTGKRKTVYGGDSGEVAKNLSSQMNAYRYEAQMPNTQGIGDEAMAEIERQRAMVGRAVDVASSQNYDMNNDQILTEFNAKIKQQGRARAKSPSGFNGFAEDYINDVYKKAGITQSAGVELKKMALSDDYAKERASKIMASLSGVQAYDMDAVRSNLHRQASSAAESLGQVPQVYKDELVGTIIEQSTKNFEDANVKTFGKLNESYGSLVNLGPGAGYEALNWTDETSISAMSQQKIAAGEFVGAKLEDLDVDTLRGIVTGDADSYAMQETQARISRFFEVLDSKKVGDEGYEEVQQVMARGFNGSGFMSSSMDMAVDSNKVVAQMNDKIRKAAKDNQGAKEVLSSSAESIAKNHNMLDNKNIKVAIGVALALGVASMASGQFTSMPSSVSPSKRPSGAGSPDPNGNYADRKAPGQVGAPASEQTYRAQTGNGVRFKVKGTLNPNLTGKNISGATGSAIAQNGNFNINVNTRDQSHVDQSWLEQQFSNLL